MVRGNSIPCILEDIALGLWLWFLTRGSAILSNANLGFGIFFIKVYKAIRFSLQTSSWIFRLYIYLFIRLVFYAVDRNIFELYAICSIYGLCFGDTRTNEEFQPALSSAIKVRIYVWMRSMYIEITSSRKTIATFQHLHGRSLCLSSYTYYFQTPCKGIRKLTC